MSGDLKVSNDVAEVVKYLEDRLTKYPDFPKKGIVFRDTFALFGNPESHRKLIDLFSDHIATLNIDVIVGLEARGFILGSAIAYKLNIPFVPIRKKGKLPGNCVSVEYTKEYGTDIFEIQENAVKPGQKVVIVDDLIATGGTCEAACDLLKKIDAVVEECVFLVEFTDLGFLWKDKIKAKTKSFIMIDSSS